jgi:cytochrome c oxidase assembly protein subunit 15
MAHRAGAVIIWLSVLALTGFAARKAGVKSHFFKLALVWSLLLTLQAIMGAWTVLSNKAADIATLHVVLGAFSFVFGGIITVSGFRCLGLFERVLNSAVSDSRESRTHLVAEPTLAGKI